jgi:hypothetical protein
MGYGQDADYGSLPYKGEEEDERTISRHERIFIKLWPIKELLYEEGD